MKTRLPVFFVLLLIIVAAAGLLDRVRVGTMGERLSGLILLQVEESGEAWYVYPENERRYFLGPSGDAYNAMKKLGLGIGHDELVEYLGTSFPDRLVGMILLDIEANGEAYYIYPSDKKAYYLGRPEDSLAVVQNLGLGITNKDLTKVEIGF